MSDRIFWLFHRFIPMVFRRVVPIIALASLMSTIVPLPAHAVSTEEEVEMGQESDKEIIQTEVIETDPLLNAYIQGIANKLWTQVARKDVPYNIKIIKGTDVNSFATLGGYVYIEEGMIDFVQSDDEMAGVIGHETGHIERRHVLTMQTKLTALQFLFGIASMFSPIIYNLGNLAEAGIAELSRADELQADRYGLQLMSRAGYDPEAMVTMMSHLGVLEDEHESVVDKYLEDHPDPKDRVRHLVGYPELDPAVVTPDEKLVRAVGDEERARYNIASIELTDYLKTYPGNTEALLKLGQAQLALGQTSKSEQTLAEVVQQKGNPEARATALQNIAGLREINMHRVSLTQPDLPKLQGLIVNTENIQNQAAAQLQGRADEGRDEIKNVMDRVQAIGYEIPNLGDVQPKPGSRLEAMLKNLDAMTRAVNSAIDDSTSVVNGVGTLERGKESGMLKENSDLLGEMQAPLALAPIPADSLAIFPMYPSMLAQLQQSDADLLASVDAARAALILTDQGLGDLDAYLKDLDHAQMNYQGDVSDVDTKDLMPLMQKAADSLNGAATAASQASQLYNLARSRNLSDRISLLGVGDSPQRFETLRYALDQRVGLDGISYDEMLKQNLTPGDVSTATIIAADVKSTPQEIISDAQLNHRSLVDEANARGMHAWPLEIFLGLTYLNYTDDPVKELHESGGQATGGIDM